MFYHRFYHEHFDAQGVLEHVSLSYPPNYNFAYDVLDPLAELYPDKLAMLWHNEHGDEKRLTFRDFSQLSNQAANALRALGLVKGDVLMVSLKSHYEYWYLALAAHKLGLLLSPVFHLLSAADFAYRMQKSHAKCMIVTAEGDTCTRVRAAAEQLGFTALYTLREERPGFSNFSPLIEAAPNTLARVETRADEPMLLYFTSGTTGEPKGVLHDHAFTLPAVLGARYMQDVSPDSLHFATGNTAWEVVCGTKFYGQWLCEAALFVYDYDRFHAPALLALLERLHVTSMMAQPTVYRQLLAAGMDRYDLSAIRCFAVGGEKLTKDVSEAVERQTGQVLYEGYAQSEAGLIAANSKNAGRRDGSLGKVLPKYHLEILKDDGSYAAPGEHGEIVLLAEQHRRPIGLLMGYFEDPEADAGLWDGDVFHTGDEGYRDADGFLYYVGRSDGLIKTRGYRVSPFEIENELSHHPAVYECLAVGAPDELYGQHIHVYVRLQPGFAEGEPLREELLRFHNDNCTGFKKIKTLDFVTEFARNSNGKIIRKQFAEG